MRTLLAVLIAAAILLPLPAAALEVNLTVEERLGVQRTNEPVTSGVPLPKGAVENTDGLRLLDAAGRPVPAQFSVANRWWDDGSIKWLHVDFQASVPAGETATYVLRDGAAAPAPDPPANLEVTPVEGGLSVNTGPLQFVVKENGFNLFDSVVLNGEPVVSGDDVGFALTIGGETYSPAFYEDTEIKIEDQGPMKAVILITGRNVKEDGTGYGMDYRCRIYAYAGSTRVKVVYTVENRRGNMEDHIAVADWAVTIPTRFGRNPRYAFGLADEPVGGNLTALARLDVPHTDVYQIEGPGQNVAGNPHEEEPPWIGMLDVTGGDAGVTVAVKHFWQKWAKSLSADADGVITIGLWTDRAYHKGETTLVDADGCAQFFAGIARTHEIWFNFHDGAADVPRRSSVAPANEPLFARCEPAWYCQGTKAFGDLSEADPEVYLPEYRERVEGLNRWAEGAVRRPLQRWRTSRTPNGKVDSYGLLSWGDGVEQIKGDSPQQVHWEGGYYDYMFSILLNFARTGDLFFLWTADTMIRHNADVHHTHHDEQPGRARYCPSREHIRMDRAGFPPFASPTFNHWKNMGAFYRWYLTGDHRAREAALETMNWATRLGNRGIDFGQPRSICHGILGLWAGYDATGEQRYLDALQSFARTVAQRITDGRRMGSGAWQRGMAIQGLCWYVENTGDETVIPAIETALRRDFDQRPHELAYGFAFMWKHTGNPEYFSRAIVQVRETRAEGWMQRFGNHGRSRLYAPTILRKDAPRRPPENE